MNFKVLYGFNWSGFIYIYLFVNTSRLELLHYPLDTCICNSAVKMNIVHHVLWWTNMSNIPSKCYDQAGPSSGRKNTSKTRYIGTFYLDFGSIHVDTVTFFNRPADFRKYFFYVKLKLFPLFILFVLLDSGLTWPKPIGGIFHLVILCSVLCTMLILIS
jgi:hypothetical protein